MTESILDLAIEQPEERSFITIDGERIELAEPDDFSIIETKGISRDIRRLGVLEEKESVTEAEEREYNALLDKLIHQVVPEIGDRVTKLRRSQQGAIIQSFFSAARSRQPTPRVKTATPSSSPSPA